MAPFEEVQRFETVEAKKLYEETYLLAKDTPVRDFLFDWLVNCEYKVFTETLTDFGLLDFVRPPPPANLTLVREFYSNAHD